MELKIFAIWDRKAQVYRWPNFARDSATAVRALSTGLKDPRTEMANFPDDFELYEVGAFDDSKGQISGLLQPGFVVSAKSLLSEMGKQGVANAEQHG